MNFAAVDTLCEIENPLNWDAGKQQLMVDACRTMARFHCGQSLEVRQLYNRYGFHPDSLQGEEDLAKIPSIGVTAMKYFLLTSLPPEQAVLKLTSSGTKGQKTQIWFDQDSLDRVQRMLDVYMEQEGLFSTQLTNYLVFNYNPDDAGDLGIAYSEKNQMRFAPQNEAYFAVNKDATGQWQFDKPAVTRHLKRYQQQGLPVRIMAMPAFLHEYIRYVGESGIDSLKLPAGSAVLTGGGWKAAEDKSITRGEFRSQVAELFGIDPQWIRDGFGMAEHSAPYFECGHHRFHVPVYNRILIRDPETMQVQPPGVKGLMQLITPFNAMMPTLSLLSTDWAMIDAEPCECGWRSPTFQLLGRAGKQKHKGCALTAEDIVKRS